MKAGDPCETSVGTDLVEVDADGPDVGGTHGGEGEEAVSPLPAEHHPLVVAEEFLNPAGHAGVYRHQGP